MEVGNTFHLSKSKVEIEEEIIDSSSSSNNSELVEVGKSAMEAIWSDSEDEDNGQIEVTLRVPVDALDEEEEQGD